MLNRQTLIDLLCHVLEHFECGKALSFKVYGLFAFLGVESAFNSSLYSQIEADTPLWVSDISAIHTTRKLL